MSCSAPPELANIVVILWPSPPPPTPPNNVPQQDHATGQTCKLDQPLEHMSVTLYAWSRVDRHHIVRVKAMDKPC